MHMYYTRHNEVGRVERKKVRGVSKVPIVTLSLVTDTDFDCIRNEI